MRTRLAHTLDTLGAWLMHAADTIDPPTPCDCALGHGPLMSDEQAAHITLQRIHTARLN